MSASFGHFEGRVHHYPVHVFYEDTDFTGVVYHANYLRFFERGRSSFLHKIGVEHATLWEAEDPMAFSISKIDLAFKKPARVNDDLVVQTTYDALKGARILISQNCYCDDQLLVSAHVEAVAIAPNARPKRPPKWFCERLEDYLL